MKTMRRTSITSTIGVTLISAITVRRRFLRLPTSGMVAWNAIDSLSRYPRSSICRDRMAANSSANPSIRWACRVTSEENLL